MVFEEPEFLFHFEAFSLGKNEMLVDRTWLDAYVPVEKQHLLVDSSAIEAEMLAFIQSVVTVEWKVRGAEDFKRRMTEIKSRLRTQVSVLKGLVGHITETVMTPEQIAEQWPRLADARRELVGTVAGRTTSGDASPFPSDVIDTIGQRLQIMIGGLRDVHQMHVKVAVRFFGVTVKVGRPNELGYAQVVVPENASFTLMATQQVPQFMEAVIMRLREKTRSFVEKMQIYGSGFAIEGVAGFDIRYVIVPFCGCGKCSECLVELAAGLTLLLLDLLKLFLAFRVVC